MGGYDEGVVVEFGECVHLLWWVVAYARMGWVWWVCGFLEGGLA